jgi:PhzF family phenazine biosynthesis protein
MMRHESQRSPLLFRALVALAKLPTTMTLNVPYFTALAWATNPFEGNPACVVLLEDNPIPSFDILCKISANFRQPMTVFVSTSDLSNEPKTANFNVRFIPPTGNHETRMCGHASLATAKILFEQPGLVPENTEVIRFQNFYGQRIEARKVDAGWIEISLPAGTVEPIPKDLQKQCVEALNETFGRELKIKYIGRGAAGYHNHLFVELDVEEDLAGSIVNPAPLVSVLSPQTHLFLIRHLYRKKRLPTIPHVITTDSPTGDEFFVSRMLCPKINVVDGEDPVCGSAHGLLTPYWSAKKGFTPGQLLKATQVSPRGGKLRVAWAKNEDVVRLQGQVFTLTKGEFLLGEH